MSFTITTDVVCDNCHDWADGHSSNRINKTAAWKAVKQRGWTKVKGKHLCPLCNGKAEYRHTDGSYTFKNRK